MSIILVNEFQLNIYQILAQDAKLAGEIKQIYLSLAQNASYPFLLINMNGIQNLSRFEHFMYEIKFEICIYARDKTTKLLSELGDHIISILKSNYNYLAGYLIQGMQVNSIDFDHSQDLLTTKMLIKYQALITGNSVTQVESNL